MQKFNLQVKLSEALNQELDIIFIPVLVGSELSDVLKGLSVAGMKRLPSKAGESITVFSGNKEYIFYGIEAQLRGTKLSHAIRKPLYDCYTHGGNCGVWLKHISDIDVASYLAVGVYLSTYHPAQYKSENTQEVKKVIYLCVNKPKDKQWQKAEILGKSIRSVMTLVDTPSNIKTPDFLAQYGVGLSKKYKISCTVLNEVDLAEQGYGALMAVGQGSDHPPRLVEMIYEPKKYTKTVAFVGKGITFDTGGISIKPSTNMHYMKCDMGGAAVVFGMMEAVALMHPDVRVIGLVPTAENAVDASSIKPGDVIYSYSGKSIEIIDTDAEGRLILADALYHACIKYQPDVLIDLATLTGSIVRSLGSEAAGLFTVNATLQDALVAAGETTRERVWPMPMYDEYKSHLHSDVADVANLSSSPVAGATAAAKFLEVFTDQHSTWAHLDIAGVAFDANPFSKSKSATGYGVGILVEWLVNWSKK